MSPNSFTRQDDYAALLGEVDTPAIRVRVEEEQNLPDSPDDAASSTGSDVGTGNFATAATLRPDLEKQTHSFFNWSILPFQYLFCSAPIFILAAQGEYDILKNIIRAECPPKK